MGQPTWIIWKIFMKGPAHWRRPRSGLWRVFRAARIGQRLSNLSFLLGVLPDFKLTALIGIASNNQPAKIASDHKKPDGLAVISGQEKVSCSGLANLRTPPSNRSWPTTSAIRIQT